MTFADAMNKEVSGKLTENGAFAYNSISNPLIELFAQIGALRTRSEEEIEKKFLSAYHYNPILTTKMLFYAGNIRGGLGERRTFRICLRALANYDPMVVAANVENIGRYNRFDSLFCLIGTRAEEVIWYFIKNKLEDDMFLAIHKKPVSLLAKWMPSEKASSKKTKEIYHTALKRLNLTPRAYRKKISYLRKYIDVTERKMSAKKWNEINYPQVPSLAMKNYHAAFYKHDKERFGDYLVEVSKGEKKINASTLFPYNLTRDYVTHEKPKDPVIEEQWKALPNYVKGDNNIIVMADVSGSMCGTPMETSIGLAIYFAERNTGAYKDVFMTFSSEPRFMKIRPMDSLYSKVNAVLHGEVGYSTNLKAAFDKILDVAVSNGILSKDMPQAIVVISDMEIDKYMRGYGMDFIETVKEEYAEYGYKLPKLILWNVEARHDTYLTQSEDVIMVSGQSVSVFNNFIGALNGETAMEVMLRTLEDPMYDAVVTEFC